MARIELAANAEEAMDKRQCNPWTWQDAFGFSQAWRVEGAGTLVFVSGQGPISADGAVVAADDFEAQARQTFENLRTVLEQAGASFDDVVKVTTFLTDTSLLREYAHVRNEFITGPSPASTVVEVSALALPGMMIEVEAIAAL
jgi:enamine deaminase RidA (YjgF/YER057c/UK114 family)